MSRRREFMTLLGGTAAAWPFAARTQQSKPIGVLWHAGNEQEEEIYLGALRQGFSDIGYVEGKHFVLETSPPNNTSDTTPLRPNLSHPR